LAWFKGYDPGPGMTWKVGTGSGLYHSRSTTLVFRTGFSGQKLKSRPRYKL